MLLQIYHVVSPRYQNFFYQSSINFYFSSRMIEIQEKLSERALELLALPEDEPCYILDVGQVNKKHHDKDSLFSMLVLHVQPFIIANCSLIDQQVPCCVIASEKGLIFNTGPYEDLPSEIKEIALESNFHEPRPSNGLYQSAQSKEG